MMGKRHEMLEDPQLRQLIRAGQPTAVSDGEGLTFTLSAAGTATWILRFYHRKRRQELTLGRYPVIGLQEARRRAKKARADLADDINPADRIRKVKEQRDWTVRQLIADYRAKVLCSLADSTQRSYGRNLKRIENGMGALSVRSVAAADIVAQIERVKAGWVELFTLWCVLKAIFKHAAGKRMIDANPCAGVVLEAIIGKRPEVKKRLMLSDKELQVLTNAEMSEVNRLTLCVLLATGVRASELFTARQEHVYLKEARWHIPTSKTGPEIDIPLAPAVVEWFERLITLAGGSAYVLPARLSNRIERLGGDGWVSKDALREAIDFWIDNHAPKIRRFTPHDLRSTMKSHMRKLGVSRDISEMCLNHKLKGVEGIYDQHNYYDERRDALELWAAFIVSCAQGHEWNVVPMRRAS
jgi:integrase